MAALASSMEKINQSQLQWRCRRGMLELDIMLNAFMQRGCSELTEEQAELFITLLDYPDQVLLDLLLGKTRAADIKLADLIAGIRKAVV